MSLTVQNVYDYARTSLDSDATELPDSLMAVWFNAAEARIFSAVETSERLFAARENVTGTGLTQAFTLSQVNEIRVISGPLWELEIVPHHFALQHWPRNATEGTPVLFGHATHASIDDKTHKLWLWPAPSSGDVHIVTGLKTPALTDCSTTTNVSVLSQRYVQLIGEYLVARGYELQQNAQMASMKMARFEAELDVYQRDDNRPIKTDVITLGSVQLRKPRTPIGRLAFPWE